MTIHISARLAWHNDGWNGRITACLFRSVLGQAVFKLVQAVFTQAAVQAGLRFAGTTQKVGAVHRPVAA